MEKQTDPNFDPQKHLEDVLDAALDGLDDNDDEDEDDDDEDVISDEQEDDDNNSIIANEPHPSNEGNNNQTNDKLKSKVETQSTETNNKSIPSSKPVVFGPERPPTSTPPSNKSPIGTSNDPEEMLKKMMEQMMNITIPESNATSDSLADEAILGNLLDQMRSQLEAEIGDVSGIIPPLPVPPSNGTPKATPKCPSKSNKEEKKKQSIEKPSSNVNKAIADVVEEITRPTTVESDDDDDDDDNNDGSEENDTTMLNELNMLNDLLKGIGSGDGNPDTVLEGMMEQLLSKELMYEPMKEVSVHFPQWLQENKTTLSQEEYDRRCRQNECFQKLVHTYETEPNNFGKLMEYMQNVQEYGHPPIEIVKKIAPGIELDEDGMPAFEDGRPLPPFLSPPGGSGNEECCIM